MPIPQRDSGSVCPCAHAFRRGCHPRGCVGQSQQRAAVAASIFVPLCPGGVADCSTAVSTASGSGAFFATSSARAAAALKKQGPKNEEPRSRAGQGGARSSCDRPALVPGDPLSPPIVPYPGNACPLPAWPWRLWGRLGAIIATLHPEQGWSEAVGWEQGAPGCIPVGAERRCAPHIARSAAMGPGWGV